MLSHNYSYQECLDNSKKVAWKEDDVFAGKNFDFSKRFLPNRLSGVDNITCLNDNEKRQLNQIMGNAYCHIFAFVEEFIIPMVTQTALEDIHGEEVRLRSLRLDPRSGRCGKGRPEQVAAGRALLDHGNRMVYPAPLRRTRA